MLNTTDRLVKYSHSILSGIYQDINQRISDKPKWGTLIDMRNDPYVNNSRSQLGIGSNYQSPRN